MADSVLIDRELSPVARLVYCELSAWVRKGENTVSRGHRSMAERLGIHRETVARCLKRLEERGHLQRVEAGRGIRGCYVLLSGYDEGKEEGGAEWRPERRKTAQA